MDRSAAHRRTVLALFVGVALCGGELAAAGKATDWPEFRGSLRDGISKEQGLLQKWPESGPEELWRVKLGEGYSAISVVGDRLYTMYAGENEGEAVELAAAFSAADGKQLWAVPIGPKKDTEFGNGPRSTPTVAGDTVYVLGSEGAFAALATADGKVRWKIELTEAFGSEVPYWGFSMSPLVTGDQVIVEGGGTEGKSYAGLNTKTGEVLWSLGKTAAGYNSPLRFEMGGKERIVYIVNEKLVCIDGQGKEIWSHPWPQGETHAMPVFIAPDKIFASGVEGVGAHLLRISESGGEAKVEELWQTRFMRNHFSSSVLHGEHLYGFDNATLKSIAVADGKLAWAKRGLGKGSLIYADGHLAVLSDEGELLWVEASPEGFVEKGRVQALEGLCWTAPVLSDGKLYLRNHEEMVVYDLRR
jgi:outer membrane protein assembly factor BamB